MSATMLATAVRVLARLIDRNGIAPDGIFLDCGLDPRKMQDSRARYPADRVRAAWKLANEQIRKPCWGLQAGQLWDPGDFHALGYAFFASRTLKSALQRLRRYYAVVVQDVELRIQESADSLTLIYGLPDPSLNVASAEDARASIWIEMCRRACAGECRLTEIAFIHPCKPCSYEEFFGCKVRYEVEEHSVTIPRQDVERYLPAQNLEIARSGDEHLNAYIRSLTTDSLAERARHAIVDELPSGKPSAADVARLLAISPRTLQRKLQQEGTTFEEVVESVRRDLAQEYVRSGDFDFLEITYLMGFSTLPAFSRAYKTWTGTPPSEHLPQDRHGIA
jgi:AraC-like DNA-binding protein